MELPYIHYLPLTRFVRNTVTSAQQTLETRRNAIANAKKAQVISYALFFGSIELALINAYHHHFLGTLGFLTLSYVGYECKTVAENTRAILEMPVGAVWTSYTQNNANKILWNSMTDGAPIARETGLFYLYCTADRGISPQTASLFSKIRGWFRI